MTRATESLFDSAQVVPRATVVPETNLALLSRREVDVVCHRSSPKLHDLFRRCALAVLASGAEVDDVRALFERFRDFDITLEQSDGGLRLVLHNAPATAFVGDTMIRGVREHLFAVLRDILYITQELERGVQFDLESSAGITDAVFMILRNAGVVAPRATAGLVVCWGGHSIDRIEYDYTKEVGYALGLRALDVCTGCGPGAMKGPMKGATIAHAKQRISDGRYIGITEPGIIAAESPNPIVNALVIMPDMEKRLEAFVRLAHGIVVFPGGVGTAEEILYLLGLLAHPDNAELPLPVVLTGPRASADYFRALDAFIRLVLGPARAARYRILIDDPHGVAEIQRMAIQAVLAARKQNDDAPNFNWRLTVAPDYQTPFVGSHENIAALALSRDLSPDVLASWRWAPVPAP